jgi:predicted NAD-dependent protein-ADP-ribosyltransferase YbiA (DUF1768 family)
MTREQFLSGVSFKVKGVTYKGAETYYYDDCIMKQSRSSINEEVLYRGHHANVIKVGRVGFTAFSFVLNKKVVVRYRFEDLVEFIREA